MTPLDYDEWYEDWTKKLDQHENSHIAVTGQATLRQAIALLQAPESPGSSSWHLVVARTDGTWAVRKFAELYTRAKTSKQSKLDVPLDQLDWLSPATVVDIDAIASEDAEREARGAPGKVVVVVQDDELLGILYAGAVRGETGSTSELIALAGKPADLSRYGDLRIPRRRPKKT